MMDTTGMKALAGRFSLTTTEPLSLWHWSDRERIRTIAARLGSRAGFGDFSSGACGQGLYTSFSAVDLIDRGDEVIHLYLKPESRLLIVHPDVFGVGFSELFDFSLKRLGWTWKLPKPDLAGLELGGLDRKALKDSSILAGLMDAGECDGCLYSYGMNLAVMLRTSHRAWTDPSEDVVSTIRAYSEKHPEDVPMLAPDKLRHWLAARGAR